MEKDLSSIKQVGDQSIECQCGGLILRSPRTEYAENCIFLLSKLCITSGQCCTKDRHLGRLVKQPFLLVSAVSITESGMLYLTQFRQSSLFYKAQSKLCSAVDGLGARLDVLHTYFSPSIRTPGVVPRKYSRTYAIKKMCSHPKLCNAVHNVESQSI